MKQIRGVVQKNKKLLLHKNMFQCIFKDYTSYCIKENMETISENKESNISRLI